MQPPLSEQESTVHKLLSSQVVVLKTQPTGSAQLSEVHSELSVQNFTAPTQPELGEGQVLL
jgi:hypothetical protein